MTNTDYKILVYILSMHLEEHLTDIIHANQTAYMSKRFIGTNVRPVQDYLDYCHQKGSGGVLFLNFKKAFDSVSHQCLFAVLQWIGIPSEFLQWVRIMYHEVTSCVRHKNWLMPQFVLGRGVHQGCPLSCHLFNLVSQVLIYTLQQQGLFA